MPQFRLNLTWSLLPVILALLLWAQSGTALWPNRAPVVIDRSSLHPAPARTISVELLRYPLSGPALHMLQKAVRVSEAGDHAGASKQLQKTLAKFPDSGAYAYSLLGVEYLKTDQIPKAVDALERAEKMLPHDACNHANLGLALLSIGQYDRAEPELR